MRRKCIDELVHHAITANVAWSWYTPCAWHDPGIRLYERLSDDTPLTCLQCVVFEGPLDSGSSK